MIRSRSHSRLAPATLATGALLWALWIAQNWGGERFGATALLLYLPQHGWGLPPLLLLIWSLKKRRFRLALFNAVSIGFWAHFLWGFQVFTSRHNPNAGKFRVMSYNIGRGAGGIDALERAIRAQKPDIVCLQEAQGIYRGRAFAPGAQIAARFPGWSVAHSGDVMTLARFPLRSKRDYPLRGTRRILETTLETPRGLVRVLNVHVSTSFSARSRTEQGAKIGRLGSIRQIIANSQPAAQARLDQIAPLRRAISKAENLPLVVAGDFNSPPRGRFFHAISRDLNDACRRGAGTAFTFPARLPLLPIDHLLSRDLDTIRAFVPAETASDHRPVVADFNLRAPR